MNPTDQAAAIAIVMRARSRAMLNEADVHIDAHPGMRRKRVQPRGSRLCPDCGERRISANTDRCAHCAGLCNSANCEACAA